ncbi:MAG TPA: hypothetical protein VGX25_03570 [Actinophytocola sp.]|uniref:hypothetical protein n=1 Tax=Actinophytocola sp. TaxID=1872138 RepID=UPI002DDCAFC9|nr:hypothetical protein [Actinophytocola sp.]HEV2778457.1 hypothetical protein [Actinophytocola sp.]
MSEVDTVTEPVTRVRQRRWVTMALAFVLAGSLGAVASLTWYWLTLKDTTRVSDAAGVISVDLPDDWARQKRDDGWSPTVAGLTDGSQPALEVSGDLASWRRPDSDAPGVFVGITRDLSAKLPPEETSTVDLGCAKITAQAGTFGSMPAIVHRRSDCPGPWTVTEAALTGDGFRVYVQIKQPAEADRSAEILGSLMITPDRLTTSAR